MTLFVDTSVFYAVTDRGDHSNVRAKSIISAGERLLTTDHVLVETWLLIQRRLGAPAADRFWRGTRGGGIGIETVSAEDLDAAFSIGEAFPDQSFSIVDRTSFVAMQRLGLTRVASFDRDFAIFRFGPRRDRAFEIVG